VRSCDIGLLAVRGRRSIVARMSVMTRRALGVTFCAIATVGCSTLDWGPGPAEQPSVRSWQPNLTPVVPALPPFQPPPVEREATVDTYHGVDIADPYRWLEDQDGERTRQFVQQQNERSRAFLDALPQRAAIRDRLAELWNFPRTSAPERHGDRWFWTRNDGLQNHAVWFVGDAPDAAGRALLDPNTLSSDGTVAISGARPSHDGRLLAYATSARGSDWQQWHVLEVDTGRLLPDTLHWAKFTQAAWTHDGKGFFYQRYPAPADGEVYEAQTRSPQLCYHLLGTTQDQDRVVYERPDEPSWLFRTTVSDDGRFLVLDLRAGTSRRNRLAWLDLAEPMWSVQPLRMLGDASWQFVGNDGDTFWLLTDQRASRGALHAIDRRQPDAEPIVVLAEGPHALQNVQVCGGRFLATYLVDAAHELVVHGLDGQRLRAIDLPALGSIGAVVGRPQDQQLFVTFQSFLHAPSVLRHDLATAATTMFRPSELAFDSSQLVTERRFFASRDGTRLCVFLTHHKDLPLDGTHPTYLYGYGGFAQAMTPRFSVPNLVFVERGGIYAQAVLRGGSEYGEAWHRAGMLENKQNVFDDFTAAADFLVRNRYTSPTRLAIGGGSNGGLLVGAVLTQHPERFGAAIPEVGVLDMLRYHTFTIGWAWASEYGTSADPQQFAWLRAWSPLHNVGTGRRYPPTMVMTGDHDDRVLPGHSYKFAAALQAAQAGPAPILLRVETSAGHGAGKPIGKLIDEAADRWAFLAAVFGE
jgi:prolyl oligopeptidase